MVSNPGGFVFLSTLNGRSSSVLLINCECEQHSSRFVCIPRGDQCVKFVAYQCFTTTAIIVKGFCLLRSLVEFISSTFLRAASELSPHRVFHAKLFIVPIAFEILSASYACIACRRRSDVLATYPISFIRLGHKWRTIGGMKRTGAVLGGGEEAGVLWE